MRMWMIDPATMCRKHLLGEHYEIHMIIGAVTKGKNLAGYIEKGLIFPWSLYTRHCELAEEMVARGYKHNSNLEKNTIVAIWRESGWEWYRWPCTEGEKEKIIKDLHGRCSLCRNKYISHKLQAKEVKWTD